MLRREDEADTTMPLEHIGMELEPPETSSRVETVRKIDCSTRDVTWSTNADVATVGLTAGADTAEALNRIIGNFLFSFFQES